MTKESDSDVPQGSPDKSVAHYTKLLLELSRAKGVLGQIFTKSQNKIQDPAKLFKLIDMIDKEQWNAMART